MVFFIHMRQFHVTFLLFFRFFWIGFPNPFIVHSRPNFLFEPKFHFLASGFCSHAALWLIFNVRTAIAGAVIALLLVFYFVVKIFVTTKWRQRHFLFIRSYIFNWSSWVTSIFALSGASFLFIRVISFLVTRDLAHSQKWHPHFEIDFYLV